MRVIILCAAILALAGVAGAGIHPGVGTFDCAPEAGQGGIAVIAFPGDCLEFWPEGGGNPQSFEWQPSEPPVGNGYWKTDGIPPKYMTFNSAGEYEHTDGHGSYLYVP